jgi:hypothetical protein
MSLAVQSATEMRSGYLARANGYSNQEITTLRDLVVKGIDDMKGIRFRALLTIYILSKCTIFFVNTSVATETP